MLYIFTGLPGAGKTLYTLWRVQNDPQLKGREVFYHGIPELTLPWSKAEPQEWEKLPDGSVVVIDEAQKVFPCRPTGSLTPKWIEALTEHRHRGFDFVLITQDATLIDAFVRKLAERHFHLKRPFGLDYAQVHEFHGVSDPKNGSALKQAIVTRFKHPKSMYGVYKSATIHAVKKRVPFKVFLLPILVIGIAWLSYVIYGNMMEKKDAESKSVAASSPKPGVVSVVGNSVPPGDASDLGLPRNLGEYLEHFTPRTSQLPQSAPVFDKLVAEVKDFPRVAACLEAKDKCWCYTQQGSRLDIRPDICVAFVKHGQFDPYKVAQSMAIVAANGLASTAKSVVNPQP